MCGGGDMCDRGHAWQGACVAGGIHSKGHWRGGVHVMGCAWHACPPPCTPSPL